MSAIRLGAAATKVIALLAMPIWLGLSAPVAVADEMSVRAELKTEASSLLERGEIAMYDRRATELRRTRELTPAGIWKLSLFYKGPDNWPATQPGAPIWIQIEAATETYLREHPDSPSAVVADARLLVSHAWTYRGSGWGRDLSTAQRDGFDTFLERARRVLDEHRDVGARDPEWYSLRIQVMNGQNVEKAAILALAREALDLEPTYQPIDYVAANALLPKWGGSAELLQQFVALAIAKSSAFEGNQAYARIMFNIARADPKPVAALTQVGVKWPTLKTSLEEIVIAYPDPWNLNTERAMACLIGTQTDFNAVQSRVAPGLIPAAWFDSAASWPECQQRQELAKQSAVTSWVQASISTPPSGSFATAGAAGVMVALALLYVARRQRSGVQEEAGGLRASGVDSPRIYRVTPAWKAGIVLAAGILSLGSLVVAWQFGVVAVETRDTPSGLIVVFCAAIFASGAVFFAVDAFVSALVLHVDQLEVRELWRERRIVRADIETQQILHPRNSSAALVLRLKAPSKRKIKLAIMWDIDQAWKSWFAAIPDIDAERSKAFEAAIEANTDLGSTPAERQQRLVTARSTARIAIWVNAGLVGWAYIYPRPYEALIFVLAALPWAAIWIMARSPGLYTFNAPRGSGRPDLTILLISPGLLLMLRAILDVQVLDWQLLLLWAGLVAVILMVIVMRTLPAAREKFGTLVLTLVLVLPYGYGVSALGDALLDHSSGSKYQASVYAKHVSSGRNRTPNIRLGPWGPRTTEKDVAVSWDVYRSISVGDTVCVLVRQGALGVPWYRVAKCQSNHTPVPRESLIW